ncbi:ThuA domain-containing protein [Paracoccus onubensis]|uniref:ThuA domain-containing protein n=1 Tax=Paracoccus onubensis TaxID=1675788 RepID=UPI002731CA91|nr:ThuA domain-containing protein [Paracoccus onubensis]MDP0929836.1 ThuA domain-containing protein [Paracoccus onubensis]
MSNKTALIFWGGWQGHEPETCSQVIEKMLVKEGFTVRREEGTRVLAEGDLNLFDLIVPLMTQVQVEKEELQNLIAAVEGGTGLGGFHGAMGDTFRMEPAYQFMVGGQWVAHPGNIVDYRVEIVKPDDPVVTGIGDFDYRSEQYFMHVDPSIKVLATTAFDGAHAPWTRDTVMPVVWKHRYGAARVFYSSLGHVATEFEVPQMREILRRGLIWAAR